MTRALYFAYGSNMHSARMRTRVPSARSLGVARLGHARLLCNKPGRDGSGKANLVPRPGAEVWGVLWSLAAVDWTRLDGFEGGYQRLAIYVESTGRRLAAQTYVSGWLEPGLLPLPSYKRFLIEGAREHGLPPAYRAFLEDLPSLGHHRDTVPASTSWAT